MYLITQCYVIVTECSVCPWPDPNLTDCKLQPVLWLSCPSHENWRLWCLSLTSNTSTWSPAAPEDKASIPLTVHVDLFICHQVHIKHITGFFFLCFFILIQCLFHRIQRQNSLSSGLTNKKLLFFNSKKNVATKLEAGFANLKGVLIVNAVLSFR